MTAIHPSRRPVTIPLPPPQQKEISKKIGREIGVLSRSFSSVKELISKIGAVGTTIFSKILARIEGIKLEPMIASVHTNMTEGEVVLSVISCLPVIGVIGSALRILVGKVQIVAGGAIGALGEIAFYLDTPQSGKIRTLPEKQLRDKFRMLSKFGREGVIHGCLNVLRGNCELTFMAATMGFGNVLLFAPNLINKRDFKPFVPYGILTRITATPKRPTSANTSQT